MLIPLGILSSSGGGGGNALTLISSTVLISDTATISFTGIPQTYKHLQLRVVARTTSVGTDQGLTINFNSAYSGSGTDYYVHNLFANGTNAVSQAIQTDNTLSVGRISADGETANAFGSFIGDIVDYSNTSKYKVLRYFSGNRSSIARIEYGSGLWKSTSAISSIYIAYYGINFKTGSRFSLYGVS